MIPFFIQKIVVYGHEVSLTVFDTDHAQAEGVSAVVIVFSCNDVESLRKMTKKVGNYEKIEIIYVIN